VAFVDARRELMRRALLALSFALAAWALRAAGSGSWTEPNAKKPEWNVVRAWVDARVANVRYHKRVFAEVRVRYRGGAVMSTIAPLAYERADGDAEIWGTDAIEIHPNGGPYGAPIDGPAMFRLRMQHDLDGDRKDEMIVTPWARLHGDGAAWTPDDRAWKPGLTSPVRATSRTRLDAYFPPFDDAGAVMVREIDEARTSVHAAVFNINDARIVDALVRAHARGVDVKLVTDAGKLRPAADWQTGDDALLAAGVPLLGVARGGRGAMHDKIAIIDGKKVTTGSFNWEPGASRENHENMVLTDDPQLVAAYAARFTALAGDVMRPRREASDPNGAAYVAFAPDEEPHRAVGRLIDAAKKSIHVAMFTAKDVEYEENGAKTSILKKLVAAKKRGVDVLLVTDHGISEAAEYFGVVSDDDQTDEWLEREGVHVVRADNTFGRYASMHHKVMVVDGEIVVTGAFNWYHDAAYLNDEDVLVLREPALAARYSGEIVDLLRRYDPAFDAAKWPSVTLDLSTVHDATRWGERVVLMGDLPQAGAWQKPLVFDAASWPTWRASLELPAGVRLRYKLAVQRADGSFAWENGDDRVLTAPTGTEHAALRIDYR
jgi:phosphatidylserine/phosphatidylglycerophosphate/cardiolipin synthase-like enzyme